MKATSIDFTSLQNLKNYINENSFASEKSLLVQFFDGRCDEKLFRELTEQLHTMLPNAVILGTSTSGEIMDGKIFEGKTILSFCVFQKTKLIPLSSLNCNYESGVSLANKIPPTCKTVIFFTEAIKSEPEKFLKGIDSLCPELIVSGGLAGDNDHFENTYISLNGQLFKTGVVGVALDNEKLHVLNQWKLNWNPIGKPMIITRADGKVIYELDNKPVFDVISFYFGDKAVINLPWSMKRFPLVKTEDGVHVARDIINISNDGGLICAGSFLVGEKVRFCIADVRAIVNSTNDKLSYDSEALWIYSCAGRKNFVGTPLENELRSYISQSKTCGFFTYGEFFKAPNTNSSKLLNMTTTILALSEEEELRVLPSCMFDEDNTQSDNPEALTHFLKTTTDELGQSIRALDGYKKMLDISSIISKTDNFGKITYVNNLFLEVSGYTREELIGRHFFFISHGDVPKATLSHIWATVQKGEIWKGFMTNRAKSGRPYYVKLTVMPIFDDDGKIIEHIFSRTDLTKIIMQQELLKEQMNVDALTKLPNKNKLFSAITVSTDPIIALLNIENFSDINLFYGIASGDKLLQEFATKLISLLPRTSYLLYKLEADNFVIFSSTGEVGTFCRFIEDLIEKIHKEQFLKDVQCVSIRVSAGIAKDKQQLLPRAEGALRRARANKLMWFLSDEEEIVRYQQNFKILNTLKYAIDNKKVIPYYQAIVDMQTKKIAKYESLMRISDEKGTIYTPDAFLKVAQKSKYYLALTRIVIEKALGDFSSRTEGININLSAEDIEDAPTVEFLKNAIKNFPEPARITLEIIETEAIRDYLTVIGFIQEFKELGIKIAIDDFGSGYSNFAYLVQFKADILKIDGTLVKNISKDANSFQVVAAINDFARRLGMQTVAEYVFDSSTNDMVDALLIDYAQGYYYSKPLPIENLPPSPQND